MEPMNTNNPHEIEKLARLLLDGQLSVEDFAGRVCEPSIADVGEAQLDLDRSRRCGFPEVVFAQGKSVEAMEKIFVSLAAHGVDVFATRMSVEQASVLETKFPGGRYNPVGRTFRIPLAKPKPTTGKVAIITAGTSDLPVAEEARETADWTGAEVITIQDVGVAGPHRLKANLPPDRFGRCGRCGCWHGRGSTERGGGARGVSCDCGSHECRLRCQFRRLGGFARNAQ